MDLIYTQFKRHLLNVGEVSVDFVLLVSLVVISALLNENNNPTNQEIKDAIEEKSIPLYWIPTNN